MAVCLEEARERGDIPPDSDPPRLASLLVDCWEGAALRSRLRRNPAPLTAMLDFYFRSAVARPGGPALNGAARARAGSATRARRTAKSGLAPTTGS
jgi:hypothetical protein